MKIYKNKNRLIKTTEHVTDKKKKNLLVYITLNKANALYRHGSFTDEIVWDGRSFFTVAKKKEKNLNRGLFLYGFVRKDANAYLKSYDTIKLPKKYPVNLYNDDFNDFDKRITGTDVNNAYWQIAYNLGIISENTYNKGLNADYKRIRLSALATLGAGKEYQVIKGGKMIEEYVNIGKDEELQKLYLKIRYTCYNYMQSLSRKLGKDFVAYRTDCIYYVDTPENRAIVKNFLNGKKLQTKQLYRIRKSLHEQASS
jgi:hypothetical protein